MRRAALRTLVAVGLLLVVRTPAGALEPVGVVSGIIGASAVAVSPDGANVYAAASYASTVFVYGRDASTGLLTKVQTIAAAAGALGVFDVSAIAISPDGKHAYFSYRKSFTPYAEGVSVWARDPGTGMLTLVEVQKEGVGGVSGLRRITTVIVSGDGQHVYGRGRSGDDAAIARFARNAMTGALTFLGATTFVSANYGKAQGIALAPDGAHLYAVGDDAILAFARDGGTGGLTHVSTATNGVAGVTGLNGPNALTLSPDGANVYVMAIGTYAYGANDDVTVLARDAGTGALTYVEKHHESRPLRGPQGVVVSGSGTRVFFTAARSGNSAVGSYARDAGTGSLTLAIYVDGAQTPEFQTPVALALSPDDAFLYVAAPGSDAIVIFDVRCSDGAVDPGEGCDDGNFVAGDGCNAACNVESCWACAGAPSICAHDDGAACDDFNVCTIGDACAAGYCVGAPNDGVACDDNSPCSHSDVCVGGGCLGTFEPDPVCRQPIASGGSTVQIFHNQDDVYASKLQWKWKHGQATTVAEFGDPVGGSTRYTTCLYEQPPGIVLGFDTPPGCVDGACWKANSRGFAFKSIESKISLKAGPDGKAAIGVTTRGLPIALGTLPLAPPVTVQLKAWHYTGWQAKAVDGCWGATFSSPKRNDDSKFKAKSD